MISPNKIIGSLVYRTREAINKNWKVMEKIGGYYYCPNCLVDGHFWLWHYTGTNNEISNILLKIGTHPNGSYVKFPSFLSFQPVRQQKNGNDVTVNYNLAIVGSVNRNWTTEEREHQVFEKLLRPVYEEFMKQVQACKYFKKGYGMPAHTYYEIFTTGEASGEIIKRYGDCIDAIEIHNLILELNTNLCTSDLIQIERENDLASSGAINLLNLKPNVRTNKK